MTEPLQSSFFEESSRVRPVGDAAAGAPESATGFHRPLALRMRPHALAEVIGHEHLLGPDSLLPRLVRTDTFGSLLFYGPPGCGKTTLAEVIAHETRSRFVRINAVLSNTTEVRDELRLARARPAERTILFIDEIHRFNKAQQDLLLPDVEAGHIRLIGATTHNPGFYVIAPLLSRSHLFRLEPLPPEAVAKVLRRALDDEVRGLGNLRVRADDAVLAGLAKLCDGDLRRALNALETLALSQPLGGEITADALAVFARERRIRYDANEDEHYDTASAFIKSMRGGDPDAAIYWMTKMLEGGEDPRFIARRLVILASEDVGLADSRGLPLAVAAFQACELVGLPECALNLAHAAIFLATAPKSNSATRALGAARAALKSEPVQPVPMWLRDSHTVTNKKLGQGAGYLYSHEFPEAISGQDYLEKYLQLYDAGPHPAGAEAVIAERLERWRKLKTESGKNIRKAGDNQG
jgi:putative ATPase